MNKRKKEDDINPEINSNRKLCRHGEFNCLICASEFILGDNYGKNSNIGIGNVMDKEKFIEGHRLIRNFQKEKREELIVNEFKWKELELVHKSLCENIEDLKKEMEKNKDNMEKQFDIAADMGNINHFISNCKIMEIGINSISKKYGWDK